MVKNPEFEKKIRRAPNGEFTDKPGAGTSGLELGRFAAYQELLDEGHTVMLDPGELGNTFHEATTACEIGLTIDVEKLEEDGQYSAAPSWRTGLTGALYPYDSDKHDSDNDYEDDMRAYMCDYLRSIDAYLSKNGVQFNDNGDYFHLSSSTYYESPSLDTCVSEATGKAIGFEDSNHAEITSYLAFLDSKVADDVSRITKQFPETNDEERVIIERSMRNFYDCAGWDDSYLHGHGAQKVLDFNRGDTTAFDYLGDKERIELARKAAQEYGFTLDNQGFHYNEPIRFN